MGCKKTFRFSDVFATAPHAAIPTLGAFKLGAGHPATPAPNKALPCLWIFPAYSGKNPSHPLCVWSVTRNIMMESGLNLLNAANVTKYDLAAIF